MFPGIFKSASLKLTGWYLVILMMLSVGFSLAIYQITTSEFHSRLEQLQVAIQEMPYSIQRQIDNSLLADMVEAEAAARTNLSLQLFYVNLFVLILGGLGGYFLARQNLKPIEKAHEAQSRFTSDASHELRTPLAVMKTELEVIIRDKTATSEEMREVLVSNLEEVDKLTKLSEMLLNLSQLDHVKLNLGPVNLSKITQSVLTNYKSIDDRFVVKIKKQSIVYGNEMAIIDLIKILIDNAIKYSPANSKIHLKISKHGDMARFEITNSGEGIKPDKLPHVFDRFFRADSSRTGHRGYGLGLALAKNIVELHKGELSVTSQAGKDTTFSFELPTKNNTKKQNC